MASKSCLRTHLLRLMGREEMDTGSQREKLRHALLTHFLPKTEPPKVQNCVTLSNLEARHWMDVIVTRNTTLNFGATYSPTSTSAEENLASAMRGMHTPSTTRHMSNTQKQQVSKTIWKTGCPSLHTQLGPAHLGAWVEKAQAKSCIHRRHRYGSPQRTAGKWK